MSTGLNDAFDQMMARSSEVTTQMLSGELPADVEAQMKRNSAEMALSHGLGTGSQSSRALVARDLGLTSLQIQQSGLSNANALMALQEEMRRTNLAHEEAMAQVNVQYADIAARQAMASAELAWSQESFGLSQQQQESQFARSMEQEQSQFEASQSLEQERLAQQAAQFERSQTFAESSWTSEFAAQQSQFAESLALQQQQVAYQGEALQLDWAQLEAQQAAQKAQTATTLAGMMTSLQMFGLELAYNYRTVTARGTEIPGQTQYDLLVAQRNLGSLGSYTMGLFD